MNLLNFHNKCLLGNSYQYTIWFFSPAGFHLKTLSNIFNVYSLITCIPVKTKDVSAFKLPSTEVCVKEELPVWSLGPIASELTSTACIWLLANTLFMYGYITSWVWEYKQSKSYSSYLFFHLRTCQHYNLLLCVYRAFFSLSFTWISRYLATSRIHELTLCET